MLQKYLQVGFQGRYEPEKPVAFAQIHKLLSGKLLKAAELLGFLHNDGYAHRHSVRSFQAKVGNMRAQLAERSPCANTEVVNRPGYAGGSGV